MTVPPSTSRQEAIIVASDAVRAAGEILKANFREEVGIHYKGRANIVTDVDLEADRCLKSILHKEYPYHNILSEETEPPTTDAEYTWILDPLDGTNNYSFGIPFFCVVVALATKHSVEIGIVYDPLRDELFAAQRGRGALLNNRPISVTKKNTVDESLIGFDLGYVDENGRIILQLVNDFWPRVYALRLMGSAALAMAYTACGRLDLYFHRLLYPWELACGQLLVREAGGIVTDWDEHDPGLQENSVIASNKDVHADFLRRIKKYTRSVK